MSSDNLKVLLMEVTQEKDLYTRRWYKLVSVTKLVFRESCILIALE